MIIQSLREEIEELKRVHAIEVMGYLDQREAALFVWYEMRRTQVADRATIERWMGLLGGAYGSQGERFSSLERS